MRATSLFVLLAGCTASAPGRFEQGIIGGSEDRGDPSVVQIWASTADGQYGCTGTVISPHVILTAAHCIPGVIDEGAPTKDPGPGTGKSNDSKDPAATITTAYTVQTGDGSDAKNTQPDGIGTVVAAYPNPLFHGDFTNGHDQAVLVMQDPLDLPVIPIRHDPITSADVGRTLRVVGYGISETGAGIKREVSMSLDRVGSGVFTHDGATQGTCNGDSGGPVFLAHDGREEIAGVTSFGDDACEQYSASSRVDTDLDFLDGQIVTNDPAGGCSMTSRATPNAEALLLVALALLLNARRRSRS